MDRVTGSPPLLRSFSITRVFDCLADPAKNRAIAEFSNDVSPVFVYLNAVVPDLIYSPASNTVTIRHGQRLLTIYPRGAVMAKVEGERDALAQLGWFQALCNDVWQRRDEITPHTEPRRPVGWLEVYCLLPRLNCRDCGEAACIAFACKLLLQQRRLEECPHLTEPPHAEPGLALEELLASRTATGPVPHPRRPG